MEYIRVSDEQPVPAPSAPRARHRRPRLKRVALITTSVVAALVVIAAAGLFVVYQKLNGNLETLDITGQLTGDRPSVAAAADQGDGKPMNILVMGSDTRVGQGEEFEDQIGELGEGQRSDTAFLVHIAGDRSRATAVSFPRDLLVDIPTCIDADGDERGPFKQEMFNVAFEVGGPACTLQTVEKLTGVFVDHFIVVDFQGFTKVVDALGGVDVCVTEPVRDSKAGLDLDAGVTTVQGEQALAFVRSRNLDPTADIGRIQRQQAFMSSMIQKLQSTGTLTNLPKLYGVLNAVTSSLTVDTGLGSLTDLGGLARQLSNISLENITFLTVPWLAAQSDRNRVDLDEDAAEQVFAALRADQPWPPVEGEATSTPTASATPTNPFVDLTIEPGDVNVTVLNATGAAGAASDAAELLEDAGFNVVEVGDAPAGSPRTTRIVAGSERQDSLKTLSAAVPSAAVGSSSGASSTTLVLYIGSDFGGVEDVEIPSTPEGGDPTPSPTTTEIPETAAIVTADTDVCESIGRTLD